MGEDNKPKNALDEFWENLGDKEKKNVRSYRSHSRDLQTKKDHAKRPRRTSANSRKRRDILGKIHAIDLINQELSNLLKPKEPDNDDNITRIRS